MQGGDVSDVQVANKTQVKPALVLLVAEDGSGHTWQWLPCPPAPTVTFAMLALAVKELDLELLAKLALFRQQQQQQAGLMACPPNLVEKLGKPGGILIEGGG